MAWGKNLISHFYVNKIFFPFPSHIFLSFPTCFPVDLLYSLYHISVVDICADPFLFFLFYWPIVIILHCHYLFTFKISLGIRYCNNFTYTFLHQKCLDYTWSFIHTHTHTHTHIHTYIKFFETFYWDFILNFTEMIDQFQKNWHWLKICETFTGKTIKLY